MSHARRFAPILAAGLLLAVPAVAASESSVPVALVTMPYRGERNLPDLSPGPEALLAGGLQALLAEAGGRLAATHAIALSPEAGRQYGEWNRLALANGQLARVVADSRRLGQLPIGLLANCSALPGMLAGLQHSGPSARPLRVGLVFIDAHGDFNTPETTLSGMLGGMPVAISAGLCLQRMRLKAGLEPALPERYIVLAGVRDTDPLEQDLLDRSAIEQLSVDDMRRRSEALHHQMRRLSSLADVIYVHVDMDVLDPKEVSGHPLTVPDGPTSLELASALSEMFRYPKAAGFGVASTPTGEQDKDGLSRRAAYNLVLGVLRGVSQR